MQDEPDGPLIRDIRIRDSNSIRSRMYLSGFASSFCVLEQYMWTLQQLGEEAEKLMIEFEEWEEEVRESDVMWKDAAKIWRGNVRCTDE